MGSTECFGQCSWKLSLKSLASSEHLATVPLNNEKFDKRPLSALSQNSLCYHAAMHPMLQSYVTSADTASMPITFQSNRR